MTLCPKVASKYRKEEGFHPYEPLTRTRMPAFQMLAIQPNLQESDTQPTPNPTDDVHNFNDFEERGSLPHSLGKQRFLLGHTSCYPVAKVSTEGCWECLDVPNHFSLYQEAVKSRKDWLKPQPSLPSPNR